MIIQWRLTRATQIPTTNVNFLTIIGRIDSQKNTPVIRLDLSCIMNSILIVGPPYQKRNPRKKLTDLRRSRRGVDVGIVRQPGASEALNTWGGETMVPNLWDSIRGERRRREAHLGGSGGMLPWENFGLSIMKTRKSGHLRSDKGKCNALC